MCRENLLISNMPHEIALLGYSPLATCGSVLGGQREAWGKGGPFFRREMHVGQIWPSVTEKEPLLVKKGEVSLDKCHRIIQMDTVA